MAATGVIHNRSSYFRGRHVEFGPDGEHGASTLLALPTPLLASVDRIIFVRTYRVPRCTSVPQYASRDHIPVD